jgi:hypothetical protein
VPYDEQTSLLDALGYIKDNLAPDLSYRWSCRMAICGSCGMMVNKVPKLACKTFLREYTKGIKVEALGNFPIERDLVVDMTHFIESLKPLSRTSSATRARRIRGQTSRPRRRWRNTISSPAASTAACATPARSWPESGVYRPGGHHARTAITKTAATTVKKNVWRSLTARTASGAVLSWATARKSVRSMSTRPPPFSRAKWKARKTFLSPP